MNIQKNDDYSKWFIIIFKYYPIRENEIPLTIESIKEGHTTLSLIANIFYIEI